MRSLEPLLPNIRSAGYASVHVSTANHPAWGAGGSNIVGVRVLGKPHDLWFFRARLLL